MNDMAAVIVPKSDQINADDLIAGPRTITIARVQVNPGTEQPVSVGIVGDRKVFRPCKGMCRVMVNAWGADSSKYVGRSLTLYRDEKVKWGGLEIGGIRIRAMSHIDGPMKMAIAESKANRKVFTVEPLAMKAETADPDEARTDAEAFTARSIKFVTAANDTEALAALQTKRADMWAELRAAYPDLADQVDAAIKDRLAAFEGADMVKGPANGR